MPARILQIVQLGQTILSNPANRAEIVGLASALAQLYLSCMAAMLTLSTRRHSESVKCLRMSKVAKILDIPEWTAREMGRRGEIPTIHFGRDVRVPVSGLRKLIAERRNGLHPREAGTVDARLPGRVRS